MKAGNHPNEPTTGVFDVMPASRGFLALSPGLLAKKDQETWRRYRAATA